MIKRRTKLLDKRFQLKTTFSIISISTIAMVLMIGVIGINISNNNKKLAATIDELHNAIEIENDIVSAFLEYSKRIAKSDFLLARSKISEDHEDSMAAIKKQITHFENFVKENFLLMTVIIVIALFQGVFLYFYLIKMTHRISGPLHVITGHMKEIIQGRKPQFRELREKDELKEFYELFRHTIEKLQKPRKK